VSNGYVSNQGSQLLVSFYVTFSSSAPGNYTIMANATDVDGLTEPWTTLGTWGLYTPNTNPTPTFTLSGPTTPVSLVAVSPNGGPVVPVTVAVTGYNGFNSTVSFYSNTAGILASGSGSPGNATVNLQATSAGPTSLTLYGSSGTQDAFLTIPLSVTAGQPTVTQFITTSPPGLSLNVDNGACTSPCTFQWTTGSTHSLSAPSPQTLNGAQYTYTGWSDSGSQSHQITVGSSVATYTANYNGPPAPAPTLSLLQTGQTIAAGGAASFLTYISQSATITSTLSVTSWTGGTTPVIRPNAITGPGWVTVIMYGPSVSSTTTYNFNVSASASSGYTQAPATLTVNPTSLQPDFILSTSTTPVVLSQSTTSTLPVTIDVVDNYTGNITFISNTPGVSILSGTLPAGGTGNLTLTLATQIAPQVVTITGSDNSGHVHQFNANCRQGGGGGGGTSIALPETSSGFADVEIGGPAVTVPFVDQEVQAGTQAASQLLAYLAQIPPCTSTTNSGSALTIQFVGGFTDVSGQQGLNFEIEADGGAAGPISTIACGGILLYLVMLYLPCTPSVTSVQVNKQNNSIVIAGTAGTITLNGSCLGSLDGLSDSGSSSPSITYTGPPFNSSSGSTSFQYTVQACPQGQPTCSATGQHSLTLLAQGAQIPVSSPASPPFETNLQVQSVIFGGTGYIQVQMDSPNGSPYQPVNTAWQAGNPPTAYPIAYVGGSQMSGTVTFSVNPPVSSTVTGLRADGLTSVATPGQSVVVNAPGLSIPAGQSVTNPVSFNSTTALQAAPAYYNPVSIGWEVTPNPNPCPQSACGPAGTSQDKLYVTLAAPFNTGDLSATSLPATVLYLATAGGPVTYSAGSQSPTLQQKQQVFQNTWNMFTDSGAGPSNVVNWQGQPLYYYRNDPPGTPGGLVVPFNGCALSAQSLLTHPNGSGQCGSWALLLLEALAANGIQVEAPQFPSYPNQNAQAWWTYVCATDQTSMLVADWSGFSGAGTTGNQSYPWTLILTDEQNNPNSSNPNLGMVICSSYTPQQTGCSAQGYFGDLNNQPGADGQNTTTPSEKAFGRHFIVNGGSLAGGAGPYFDPSYGKTYTGGPNFEQGLSGYWVRNPAQPYTYQMVRQTNPSSPNITMSRLPLPQAQVTLSQPRNSATGVSTGPTFQWQPFESATGYVLLLSATSKFSSYTPYTLLGENTTSLPLPIGTLVSGTTYYWLVYAYNCTGQSPLSNVYSFTTQ
jgi:hypothetical protein